MLEASTVRIRLMGWPAASWLFFGPDPNHGALGRAARMGRRLEIREPPDDSLLARVDWHWTDWAGRSVCDADGQQVARLTARRITAFAGRWTAQIRKSPHGGQVRAEVPVADWTTGRETIINFAREYSDEPLIKLAVLAVVLLRNRFNPDE